MLEEKKIFALNQEAIEEIFSSTITYNNENVLDTDTSCLVVKADSHYILSNQSILIEEIDFDMMYMPLKHLGYKSVITAVSELIALGCLSCQLSVKLAISSKYSTQAIQEICDGIVFASNKYNITVAKISAHNSPKGLTISTNSIGITKDIILPQKSSKKDLVCITGDLGAAYLGYQLLEREKRVFISNPQMQPNLEGYDYLLERQLKPDLDIDTILFFKENNIQVNSSCVLKNSLAFEIHNLSKKHHIGFAIYEEKLPIDYLSKELSMQFGIDPTVAAINGGEDFEFMFIIPQSEYEKISKNKKISIIGYTTDIDEGLQLHTKNGQIHSISLPKL